MRTRLSITSVLLFRVMAATMKSSYVRMCKQRDNSRNMGRQMVQVKERFEPTPENFALYEEAYRTYVQLYNQSCPLFG